MAVASPAGRKHKLAVTANLCFKAHPEQITPYPGMAKRWFKSQVLVCDLAQNDLNG